MPGPREVKIDVRSGQSVPSLLLAWSVLIERKTDRARATERKGGTGKVRGGLFIRYSLPGLYRKKDKKCVSP